MNLIPPGTNHPTGNYFCTWGIQNAIPPRYGLVGTGCSQMRDTMTAAHLFDGDDFHPVPRAERSGLYFLLDDGWDVPMGTRNPEDSSRMGRMVPDPEKFAALGDTDDARLRAMVQRAADLGYAGLGLWVSPQRPDRPADEPADPEADRPYWANRAALSGRAGVSYWKVDWGKACESVAYRTMMTECVRRYAPGLRIEHTLPIRALMMGLRIMPPTPLPMKTRPMARPFFSRNQLLTSMEQGTWASRARKIPTAMEMA